MTTCWGKPRKKNSARSQWSFMVTGERRCSDGLEEFCKVQPCYMTAGKHERSDTWNKEQGENEKK